MSTLTNYAEEAIGGHLLLNTTWAKPNGGSGITIVLFDSLPNEAGTGGVLASYPGYAPAVVPQADAQWIPPSASNDTYVNANPIIFGQPTADGTSTLAGYGFFDGTNYLLIQAFATPIPVFSDETIRFSAGSLTPIIACDCDAMTLLIGDHILRSLIWVKPNVYAVLYSTIPGKNGSGGIEINGAGYVSPLIGPNNALWTSPVSGNGLFTNSQDIEFGNPTGNWGTVTAYGFNDAASGGTVLTRRELATPRSVISGSTAPKFKAGVVEVLAA